MIDKWNIKTTDWLTRGIDPEKIAKEKTKAIKQAEKELARIEKKKRKKELRAYRKMRRKQKREMHKLVDNAAPYSYGWIDELVITQIKHMHEYYSSGNNVWQTDETRLPIIKELKHVLDLYSELDNVWGGVFSKDGDIEDKINIAYEKEKELYREFYLYIAEHHLNWWD